jgi:hypothetical protein
MGDPPVSQSMYAAGSVKGPIYEDDYGEGEGDGEDGSMHTPTESSLHYLQSPSYTSPTHTSTSTYKPAS